tara:strand:- start:89 stop:628 length:540 start_codon:yes stop_codon:yes gene_type:complete
MKFNLFFLTAFLYLIAIVPSFSDYPATSIGVIDINRVLTEAKAAKNAGEQIEKVAIDIENEIKEKDEEIIKEQNKLIESQSIMAPEAFEAKRNEYEKKVQNYNIERQEKLLRIDQLLTESRNKVLDELKPILEEISNEKGITILLEKNSVLLNAENMDITEQALKKLDKNLPNFEISTD